MYTNTRKTSTFDKWVRQTVFTAFSTFNIFVLFSFLFHDWPLLCVCVHRLFTSYGEYWTNGFREDINIYLRKNIMFQANSFSSLVSKRTVCSGVGTVALWSKLDRVFRGSHLWNRVFVCIYALWCLSEKKNHFLSPYFKYAYISRYQNRKLKYAQMLRLFPNNHLRHQSNRELSWRMHLFLILSR